MASSSPLSVWWGCGKCGHEWRATVISRTSGKDGCPHCCAADFKPLSVTHPELAAEWHDLNKDMIVKKGSRIPNEIVGTPLTPATCSKYVVAMVLLYGLLPGSPFVYHVCRGGWQQKGVWACRCCIISLIRLSFFSLLSLSPGRMARPSTGVSLLLLLLAHWLALFKGSAVQVS